MTGIFSNVATMRSICCFIYHSPTLLEQVYIDNSMYIIRFTLNHKHMHSQRDKLLSEKL